jgi:hypothetical protein
MATMDSPSAERNKEPIWSVLSGIIDMDPKSNNDKKESYDVLEVAAGCGVHTMYFTSQFTKIMEEKHGNDVPLALSWYPTDPDEPSCLSILDRIQSSKQQRQEEQVMIHPPTMLLLDENGISKETIEASTTEELRGEIPKEAMFNLMICINMIHISPWTATIGLIKVASERLKEGGILYCYGPYKVNGTAIQSNLNFDLALKSRDSEWGVRNLEDVTALAEKHGLVLERTIDMPANNLSLIFRK